MSSFKKENKLFRKYKVKLTFKLFCPSWVARAREHSVQEETVSVNMENTLVSLDYFPLKKKSEKFFKSLPHFSLLDSRVIDKKRFSTALF